MISNFLEKKIILLGEKVLNSKKFDLDSNINYFDFIKLKRYLSLVSRLDTNCCVKDYNKEKIIEIIKTNSN